MAILPASLPVATVAAKTVAGGFSMGAYKAMEVAINRTVLGLIAHCPPTLFGNIGNTYTPPENFSLITWTGMNLSTTALNAVTDPSIIGYGTGDLAVGYNLAGTGGTPVSNTDAIITAAGIAQPGKCTRNATADTHEFTGTPSGAGNDAATYAAWVASTMDPLAPPNAF